MRYVCFAHVRGETTNGYINTQRTAFGLSPADLAGIRADNRDIGCLLCAQMRVDSDHGVHHEAIIATGSAMEDALIIRRDDKLTMKIDIIYCILISSWRLASTYV